MADYREGLYLIPSHMHEAVENWIERRVPAPSMMGSFFEAVLSNDLMGAVGNADDANSHAIVGWVRFLYNYAPSECYGSLEKMNAWHGRRAEPTTCEACAVLEMSGGLDGRAHTCGDPFGPIRYWGGR